MRRYSDEPDPAGHLRCGTVPRCVGEAGIVFLLGFPLLIIPLIAFNVLTFMVDWQPHYWSVEVVSIPLLSPSTWIITASDLLFAAALALLYVEIVKATRRGRRRIVGHLLSFMVFAGAVAELLLVEDAGNSLFAFLALICLIDFFAGLTIAIRTRERYPDGDYLADYPQEEAIERPKPA